MNGSQLLEGYIPDIDASVVTRILDQGGRILGKAVCENLCFSGASFTAANGLVKHPLDPSRMSGGSSSGSAVLVGCYISVYLEQLLRLILELIGTNFRMWSKT